MKKIAAMILALAMLLCGVCAVAESAENEYAGYRFTGKDPWDGELTVTIFAIDGDTMSWTFTDVFPGAIFYQTLDDTRLTDGAGEFSVEGAELANDDMLISYSGEIALVDGAVRVTFADGQVEELSEEGGSTSRHVAALEEGGRAVTLERDGMIDDNTRDRFEDVWVRYGVAVEIWQVGEVFRCSAVLGDGSGESDVYEYSFCRYDAETDTLICEDGTCAHEYYDEAQEELISDVTATGLTATFSFDDQDRLIWSDSASEETLVLERLSVAEEKDAALEPFLGTWVCGRCTLTIGPEDDICKAVISWPNTAAEVTEWVYPCLYDESVGGMTSVGFCTKSNVTYGEDGEIADTATEYDDGAAVFAIDGEGRLTWQDMKEDAGKDMVFEKVEIEDFDEAIDEVADGGFGEEGDEIFDEDFDYDRFREKVPAELHAAIQPVVDSPEWVANLPAAQDADQLFIVAGMGMDKTTAAVSMHIRLDDGGWKQILSTPGYVGRNGLCLDADHAEGCGQTPVGVYRFNAAFGIAADPGCALPYLQVDEDDYWSGDENEHYNQMVKLSDYPELDMENSEHIIEYEYQYQYCLNISFNEEGTAGRGSAIFLHCLGPIKPYTGGCVAIPEYIMEQVMQNVSEDCVVVIDTLENLGGSL